MKTEKITKEEASIIQNSLDNLCSDNGLRRKEARKSLVEIGSSSIPLVMDLLDSPKHIFRWEALKVIAEIGSPESIPILLEALVDESGDFRWIASEGLVRIGKSTVKPLLKLILDKHDSVFVLNGAHHIFSELSTKKLLPDNFPTEEMLDQLKVSGNPSKLKVLVHKTLEVLKITE